MCIQVAKHIHGLWECTHVLQTPSVPTCSPALSPSCGRVCSRDQCCLCRTFSWAPHVLLWLQGSLISPASGKEPYSSEISKQLTQPGGRRDLLIRHHRASRTRKPHPCLVKAAWTSNQFHSAPGAWGEAGDRAQRYSSFSGKWDVVKCNKFRNTASQTILWFLLCDSCEMLEIIGVTLVVPGLHWDLKFLSLNSFPTDRWLRLTRGKKTCPQPVGHSTGRGDTARLLGFTQGIPPS